MMKYPVGVETVFSGMTPPPGRMILCEFTAFYSANEMVDGQGKSSVPEFKLRVFANAIRLEHGWNASLLGGKPESNVAAPLLYQQLHVPVGKFTAFGVGNIGVGLGVGYHRKNLHWFYEADGCLSGLGYSKNNFLNIGQHNYAVEPVAGFTYLPEQGQFEISSRLQCIVNFQNGDTQYQSGTNSWKNTR